MANKSSLISGIGVLSLSRIAMMVMNFVAVSHMARTLESANFGTLMFAVSYVEYFTLVANLGFDNYLPRAIASQTASRQRLVGSSLLVRFGLAVLLLPLVLLSLLFLQVGPSAKWVIVIIASSMFTSAVGLTSVYAGLQRMNVVAARGFGWSFFNMVGALVLVRGEDDLAAAAVVTVASTTIVNALVFVQYLREFGWPKIRVDWLSCYVAARRSSSFLLVLVLASVMSSFKLIVLGIAANDVQVGLFAAAWRLCQMATIPANLLATVFLPLIASQFATKQRADPSETFYKLAILTGLPIAVGGAVFTPQLVQLFFGPSFDAAVTSTSLLIGGSFLLVLNTVQGTILVAVGAQKSYVKAMLAGAIASVLLDLAMIPYLGAVGAAVSTLVAQAAISIAYLVLSRPAVEARRVAGFVARCSLSVAGAVAAGFFLLQAIPFPLHVAVQLAIASSCAAFTYLLLLWAAGLDLRFFSAEIRRVR